MENTHFTKLAVYNLAEQLADEIWTTVQGWKILARDTVGKQMIRAADSIGANIAEGNGRWNYQDNRRFVRIARGSLYETHHWLRRAHRRGLLPGAAITTLKKLLDELSPRLNAYLRSVGSQAANSQPRNRRSPRPK